MEEDDRVGMGGGGLAGEVVLGDGVAVCELAFFEGALVERLRHRVGGGQRGEE